MSAHERVQQGGNLTLADYAKYCVVGERLINFRKYLQASKQHLTVTPMDYLLPFKDLVKQFEEKYERISLLYTQYPKTDAALFKEHASSDNAGPFTFMQALVFPGILLLGNEKQIEYWTKKVVDFRVTGSYAQTEITHGSDVQGLQTQAVYDKARKVFVFNTPNMAAIKFWPGGMGCVATHLVTQAQVMCEGKSFGLQTFVVEIRDTKNKMQLAKGVDAGDIGPKLGFKTIDNGYLRFENFEAPQDALLQKFIKFDADGNLVLNQDKNEQALTYGAMLSLRSTLVRLFTAFSSKVISMSEKHDNKKEYTASEARHWCDIHSEYWNLIMSSQYMTHYFAEFSRLYQTDVKQAVKMIKDIHFMASGVKVFSSWKAVSVTREMVTGHDVGNLLLSGFPNAYVDAVPGVTYEGDNVVMVQQFMQVILLYYNQLRGGKEVKGMSAYLNKYQKYAAEDLEFKEKVTVNGPEDLTANAVTILENTSFRYLQYVMKEFQKAIMEDGIPMKVAMADRLQIPIVKMGILVFPLIMSKMARNIFETDNSNKNLSKEDYKSLELLVRLKELNLIKENLNLITECQTVGSSRELSEIVAEASENVYLQLVPKLRHLMKQCINEPHEVTTTENFKDLNHPIYNKIRDEVENAAKNIQSSVNKMSKL